MYINSTKSAIRSLTESLTHNGKRLSIMGGPLAEVAGNYVDVGPDENGKFRIADFEEANQEPTGASEEAFNAFVGNVVKGVNVIKYRARSVVLPIVKDVFERYKEQVEHQSTVPDVRVDIARILPIHYSQGLFDHIQSYTSIELNDGARNLPLVRPSDEELIGWLKSSKLVSDDELDAWLGEVGNNVVAETFCRYFESLSPIDFAKMRGSAHANPQYQMDVWLAAYLMTAYLTANVVDIDGEQPSLTEYRRIMAELHTQFGALLRWAHAQASTLHKKGKLILAADVSNFDNGYGGNASVCVEDKLYSEFISKGGNIEAVLGAALTAGNNLTDILEGQDRYVQRWRSRYGAVKRLLVTRAESSASNSLYYAAMGVLSDANLNRGYEFDKSRAEELRACLKAVATAKEDAIVFEQILNVLAPFLYPQTNIVGFLNAMEAAKKNGLCDNPREAATSATIELVKDFLGQFIGVVPVEVEFGDSTVSESDDVENLVNKEPVSEEGVNDEAQPSGGTGEAA